MHASVDTVASCSTHQLFGIGTDIVPVARIAKLAARSEEIMKQRLFTDFEARALCRIETPRRNQAYATSFAVKESVFKAMGTGLASGMSWRDIQVDDIFGNCQLSTFGRTAELFKEIGIAASHVSCSFTTQIAVAMVMLLREENSHG